jgi:hypothetical protein
MSWRRSFTHAPNNWEEEAAADRLAPGTWPRAIETRAGARRLEHFPPGSTWEDLQREGYRATVTVLHRSGNSCPSDLRDPEQRDPITWALVHPAQVTNLLRNASHPRCPLEVITWQIFPLPIRNKATNNQQP